MLRIRSDREGREEPPPPSIPSLHPVPSFVKLQKRISLWCYSQAPSDIFCWCLFKRSSDRCGNDPVVKAQQDTKQLSFGRGKEKKREGEMHFSVRMEQEKEGERGNWRL